MGVRLTATVVAVVGMLFVCACNDGENARGGPLEPEGELRERIRGSILETLSSRWSVSRQVDSTERGGQRDEIIRTKLSAGENWHMSVRRGDRPPLETLHLNGQTHVRAGSEDWSPAALASIEVIGGASSGDPVGEYFDHVISEMTEIERLPDPEIDGQRMVHFTGVLTAERFTAESSQSAFEYDRIGGSFEIWIGEDDDFVHRWEQV